MRRDLARALGALERHELDLAFGNAANLDRPLPPGTSARLVTTDPIAVLVNALPLARRLAHRRPAPGARRPPRRGPGRRPASRDDPGHVAAERSAGGLSVAQLTIRVLVMCG